MNVMISASGSMSVQLEELIFSGFTALWVNSLEKPITTTLPGKPGWWGKFDTD